MKFILSRKGFDSSTGGFPSPIFPDNSILSIPIPDKASPIRYENIRWDEDTLGKIVYDLTNGRIHPSDHVHLDPDIKRESLKRNPGWKPILGQTGSAQGHLYKHNILAGDIFLFFGLFQKIIIDEGKLIWNQQALKKHMIWGWMQIDQILQVDHCDRKELEWAQYHPHFNRKADINNTIYIGKQYLNIPKHPGLNIPGSGVFTHASEKLILTDPESGKPSVWKLPLWFHPSDNKTPLTYHSNMDRWSKDEISCRLKSVCRGQEFILDSTEYPEIIDWFVNSLLKADNLI